VTNRSILSLILIFFLIGVFSQALAQKATDPIADMGSECWTAGKTWVSQLSPEEKQKLLGLRLPEGYWEWRRQFETLKYPEGAKYPTRFDWRDFGGVTPAKSQGDCGSCWDFCAVSALEAMVKIYGEVEMNLSEQQVLSCTTYGSGCDGSYPEKAYQYIVNNGLVKEECMPYQADHWVPCTADTCEKWAKMSHWTPVCEGPNEEAIKNAIYNYGPVSTLMAVGETFHYYNDGCYDDHYLGLNHCVALVGWDDTLCGGAWIGKNSWGEADWGMDGFFYIKRTVCQIGSGTDLPHYIFHRPLVWWLDCGVDDSSPGGDGDGKPEPGETVRLDFTLKNVWSPLDAVEVTVSPDTDGIVITDDYSYLGYMDSKDTLNNSTDPMEFFVPENFPPRRVYFTFHASGDSGGGVTYTADTTFEIWVGNAEILIVDDDAGSAQDYSGYYIAAMDSLKEIYELWDTQSKADPDFSFGDYKYLIWYTGDHKTDLFTQAQAESLISFLDCGGNLFLTSQDAAEVLSGSSDPWDQTLLTDYLHVGYDGDNDKFLVVGHEGDQVGDSLYVVPNYEVTNQTSKDNLVPDPEADTVLYYTVGGAGHWWDPSDLVAGTKFQNDIFKVVLFGFGFESVRNDGGYFQGQYTSPQKFVMQRVLNWMKLPGPTIYVMSPNGGETWFIGDSTDIEWESISFDDNVKIEYSTNAGVDWTTIAGNTENDGIYRLEVPDTPSESCLVIISDASDGSPADTSDDYFRIVDYVAGDANGDGTVAAGDIVFLISYLYRGGPAPEPMAAGDANNSCEVEAGDVVYLISYLYRNGPPPLPGCA
jgi:C1A family cysteine protease